MARTKRSAEKQPLTADQLQCKLKELSAEIVSDLTAVDPIRSKELLSDFVSDLFLAVAEQARKKERRKKQVEGIATAKAHGVRFGRPAAPLPEGFDEIHRAWRGGELTLGQAANACNMPQSTFYAVAVRREQSAG